MTRVLLCSTYELGAQPLGCAVPGAALVEAGHEVRMMDLSIDRLDESAVTWADVVAFSVPMHTAVRLALSALRNVRAIKPTIRVCFHGLYATTVSSSGRLGAGDLIAAGDVDEMLVEWANRHGETHHGSEPLQVRLDIGQARSSASSGRRRTLPLRDQLPPLDRYARFIEGGSERLVGTTVSTVGCNHRCRHCPVPVIYEGRSRQIELDAILADIDQLVEAGAEHVHFADPDFLNRPRHALSVVDAMHTRHRTLTFDITVKVSHVLRYREAWEEFSEAGLRFVVSAFESTSDVVLERLDKGHHAAELPEAVSVLRRAGIEPRPSFLPFTPWTTRDDMIDLFDFVARNDLIANVDAVQFGIRLLLPPGSLLLRTPDPVLLAALGDTDADGVAISWSSADPVLDELAHAIALRTEQAAECEEDAMTTYLAVRELAHDAFGRADQGIPLPTGILGPPGNDRARLSESWFCCAEPTANQQAVIGRTS